jgi:hypothetical protein
MLKGRIFVVPLIGEGERPVERLLEATRKGRHLKFHFHLY